jgi:hypothetical protein
LSISTGKDDQHAVPDADAIIRIEKEMGISLHDFLRLLPAATDSTPEQWEREPTGMTIRQQDAGSWVRIQHAPERIRRIASLSLPVLSVTLVLAGFSADDARRFLQRFDRHYQRGGG